jgi:hypothetical protein
VTDIRIQVHVGAEGAPREAMLACLTRDLTAARGVAIVDRDAEYVLSVVLVPTTAGGYAASMAAMNVYTDVSLENLARSWAVDQDVRRRVRAAFRGAGALVDQRVLTAGDLESLCHDVARAFDADTLAPARRSRVMPRTP